MGPFDGSWTESFRTRSRALLSLALKQRVVDQAMNECTMSEAAETTATTTSSMKDKTVGNGPAGSEEALRRIRDLAHGDPSFAAALKGSRTTEEAARMAAARNIRVRPDALWRHRGNLFSGGQPTWPG